MGFSINMYNVESIRSYEDADKHFNDTRKPRTERWAEHQRPLRNTAARHLRLEKGDYNGIPYYDCMLYQTAMVRYFQPQPNGERAVWLTNHYSNSSQSFLSNAGWWNRKKLYGDDGEVFELQLSRFERMARELWGDSFTVKMIFNADNKVILDRSAHVPFARKIASTTQRAKRKAFIDSLTPVFDMMEMQYQSFISDIVIDSDKGAPFVPKNWGADFSMETHKKLNESGVINLTDTEMTQLVQFATRQCRYNAASLVNRRAYDYHPPNTHVTWQERQELRDKLEMPVDNEMLHYHSQEVQDALTPTWDDLRQALRGDFLWLARIGEGDEFQPYPQFAKTYAQSVYNMRVDNWDDLPNLLGIETYHKLTSRKGVVY